MVGVCFYGKATAIERDPVGGFRTILWEKLEEEMAYIVVTLIFFSRRVLCAGNPRLVPRQRLFEVVAVGVRDVDADRMSPV